MYNYGDDKSWKKEYSFDLPTNYSKRHGLKFLVNGELLIAVPGFYPCTTHDPLVFINTKNNEAPVACETYGHLKKTYSSSDQTYSSCIATYTPTLISLTTMGCHNVQLLKFL